MRAAVRTAVLLLLFLLLLKAEISYSELVHVAQLAVEKVIGWWQGRKLEFFFFCQMLSFQSNNHARGGG